MSRRTIGILFALIALFVGGQLLVQYLEQRSTWSTIVCNATNAGAPLGRESARVYVQLAGRPGETIAEGDLETPLRVPPGSYELRVLLVGSGDRQTLTVEGLTVTEGQRVRRQVDFQAGRLRVDAEVGVEGEQGQVVVYVFESGDTNRIVTSLRPLEVSLLAAGRYDLRGVWNVGAQEKGVIWDRQVEVRAGQQTDRRLEFQRGTLVVTAFNADRELQGETVSLEIHAAGDVQEQLLDQGTAGTPLGLAEGRYDVRVTWSGSSGRPSIWLRDVAIRTGEAESRRVEFSSGTVVVEARLGEGTAVGPFDVYVYYYRAGHHEKPVAYTPAGEVVALAAGRYDIRANLFRSDDRPDLWLRDVEVEAGVAVRHRIVFPSGTLLVRARDAGGVELIGDTVFVHVHAMGERSRAIVVARSGERIVLTEGRYDLRIEDTRVPGRSRWLAGVEVVAGAAVEPSIVFGNP